MPSVAIWNPKSGSAPDKDDLLRALGDDVELVETTADDPGPGQARDAVGRGADTVIAIGGDGTVRGVLEGVAGSTATLGIVPTGTGNLLAANLGVRSGLDSLDQPDRTTRSIDAGTANGEAFAVMAGTGFDAHLIRDSDDSLKAKIGTLAYVWSGLKNLRRSRVQTRVVVDGHEWFSGRTTMVLVGNFGTITGGFSLFPTAEPDDGKLDVAVLCVEGLREWLRVTWRLLRGRVEDGALVQQTQGSTIVVHSATPRAWELDGEDRPPANRLDIEVKPAAVRVWSDPSEAL